MVDSGAGDTRSESRLRLDPAERRQQILAAAAKHFRKQGYATVSLDQVAAEAGVTRGLLHHYFGSKRDLFLAVVRRDVRVPRSVPIVPAGADGDLESVLSRCVDWWLDLVEVAGGLWPGSSGPGGFGDSDVNEVLTAARDDLVDRMLEEVPFPDVDHKLLRSALRGFAAFAQVSTDEWVRTGDLTRAQVKALLCTSLTDLVTRSVPAMDATTPEKAAD